MPDFELDKPKYLQNTIAILISTPFIGLCSQFQFNLKFWWGPHKGVEVRDFLSGDSCVIC